MYHNVQDLFVVKIASGNKLDYGPETTEIEWFLCNTLPAPHRKRQINDYLKGLESPVDG